MEVPVPEGATAEVLGVPDPVGVKVGVIVGEAVKVEEVLGVPELVRLPVGVKGGVIVGETVTVEEVLGVPETVAVGVGVEVETVTVVVSVQYMGEGTGYTLLPVALS